MGGQENRSFPKLCFHQRGCLQSQAAKGAHKSDVLASLQRGLKDVFSIIGCNLVGKPRHRWIIPCAQMTKTSNSQFFPFFKF